MEKYSAFEIIMGGIFHQLYGSSTESLRKQTWWRQVEELKELCIKSHSLPQSEDSADVKKKLPGTHPNHKDVIEATGTFSD